MRLQFGLAMLACCLLVGCHTAQLAVTRDDLVGSYTYVSKDPASRATDHNLDRLVLQSDGQWLLLRLLGVFLILHGIFERLCFRQQGLQRRRGHKSVYRRCPANFSLAFLTLSSTTG
jgi:hypothetical protein